MQDNININPNSQFSNLTNLHFQNVISFAINFLLVATAIILFFIIIGGGIAVILGGARGDKQASAKGTTAVTSALIGLLIVFGAWAIMTLLGEFFGVNLLQLNLP
jgi:hypothetical protein